MKNTLNDLNDHLFAQLERLSDETLDQEGLEREVQRTDAIVTVSEQIIKNAQVALDAAELVAKHGCGNWETMLPNMDGRPNPPGLVEVKKPVIPDYRDR